MRLKRPKFAMQIMVVSGRFTRVCRCRRPLIATNKPRIANNNTLLKFFKVERLNRSKITITQLISFQCNTDRTFNNINVCFKLFHLVFFDLSFLHTDGQIERRTIQMFSSGEHITYIIRTF